MRFGVVVLALVLGCGRIDFEPRSHSMLQGLQCGGSASPYQEGQTYSAGDGCNSCTCTSGALQCTTLTCRDAGSTGSDASATGDGPGIGDPCAPSGGCPDGPACGALGTCCASGEQCVGGVCMCGGVAACTGLDVCSYLGPATCGSTCGSICCHGVTCPASR